MSDVRDREYENTDEEFHEICDFLDELSTRDPFMHWESGRMNFWRHGLHGDKSPQDRFFRENVHVWRAEGGAMVGLCISEYGRDDLFIEVSPSYHEIYRDTFRWMEEMWAATRAAIEIDVFDGDAQKIRRLEGEGFSFMSHFENKRTYDLERTDLAYDLEDGFFIRTFSELPDVAARVALVRSAFDNPRYAESNLRGLMASPDYVDEYNLTVVSPDEQPVAYCIGWHERAREQSGYIEPVGTHAAFRRRGFAKAVIRECFARMKANGIRTVEIASRAEPAVANLLYDSLGPVCKREVHKYRKDVRDAVG